MRRRIRRKDVIVRRKNKGVRRRRLRKARGAEREEESVDEEDVEEEANLELLCWGRLCTRWEKVAKEVRQTRVRERLVVKNISSVKPSSLWLIALLNLFLII